MFDIKEKVKEKIRFNKKDVTTTKVKYEVVDGKKVRIAKKSGTNLDSKKKK